MLIKKRCNKRGDLNNSGEPFDSLLIPNEGILHYGNRYIIKGSATVAKRLYPRHIAWKEVVKKLEVTLYYGNRLIFSKNSFLLFDAAKLWQRYEIFLRNGIFF